MDKKIIIAVMDRLQQQVTDLKWIEPDEGQLYDLSRPAIEPPACLIDLAYVNCETIAHKVTIQRVQAELRLTLVFGYQGESYAHAPEDIKSKALARYDTLERLHQALQGWDGEGLWLPMRRQRVLPAPKRQDNLKVIEAVYTLGLIDQVDSPTTQSSGAPCGAYGCSVSSAQSQTDSPRS